MLLVTLTGDCFSVDISSTNNSFMLFIIVETVCIYGEFVDSS